MDELIKRFILVCLVSSGIIFLLINAPFEVSASNFQPVVIQTNSSFFNVSIMVCSTSTDVCGDVWIQNFTSGTNRTLAVVILEGYNSTYDGDYYFSAYLDGALEFNNTRSPLGRGALNLTAVYNYIDVVNTTAWAGINAITQLNYDSNITEILANLSYINGQLVYVWGNNTYVLQQIGLLNDNYSLFWANLSAQETYIGELRGDVVLLRANDSVFIGQIADLFTNDSQQALWIDVVNKSLLERIDANNNTLGDLINTLSSRQTADTLNPVLNLTSNSDVIVTGGAASTGLEIRNTGKSIPQLVFNPQLTSGAYWRYSWNAASPATEGDMRLQYYNGTDLLLRQDITKAGVHTFYGGTNAATSILSLDNNAGSILSGSEITNRTNTTQIEVLRLRRDVTDPVYTFQKDSAAGFYIGKWQYYNNNAETLLQLLLSSRTDYGGLDSDTPTRLSQSWRSDGESVLNGWLNVTNNITAQNFFGNFYGSVNGSLQNGSDARLNNVNFTGRFDVMGTIRGSVVNTSDNIYSGGNVTATQGIFTGQIALGGGNSVHMYATEYTTAITTRNLTQIGNLTFTGGSQNVEIIGEVTGAASQLLGSTKFYLGMRSSTLPTMVFTFTQEQLANSYIMNVTPYYKDNGDGTVTVVLTVFSSSNLHNIGWRIDEYERGEYHYFKNFNNYVVFNATGWTIIPQTTTAYKQFSYDLDPSLDSTYDLGSSDPAYFANAYIDRVYFNPTAAINGVTAGILTFTGNMTPSADSVFDAGSSSRYFSNTYTDKLYLNSAASISGATAGRITVTGNVDMSSNTDINSSPCHIVVYNSTLGGGELTCN